MDTIVTPVTVITLDSTRIVHSIKADLVARYFPPVVRLVQYDQSLPVIAVSMMQNGQTYTLPSGAAANIRVHKPDATYVYNPALGCDSTRNIVYFEVTQAMAAANGDGLAIVEIVVDGDIAGTSLITLHFEENPVPEDAIESSDEWETIYELGERIIASTVTPVSTAAGMTDHNVVYLYTGTESGWNQGHMYYYNGTTWVDAGIAVTDTTLSVAGLAADAKKTGDEIATLKDGLTAVESDVTDLKEYYTTILDSAYVTDTASGAIASFPDGADNVPVKSLTVAIEPVQSGSGDPSPTNVRPISGHTSAVVTRTGANVWDEVWESGSINIADGQNVTDASAIRSKNYIPVKPNQTYYFVASAWGNNNARVRYYGKDKAYTGNAPIVSGTAFTIPADTYYMRFSSPSALTVTTYNHDVSINYPSTDHDYHAYTGEVYTIDLDGTRYGGTLDVTTGVLTVDRKYRLLNGVNGDGVTYNSNGHTANTTRAFVSITDKAYGVNNIISSSFFYQGSGDSVGIMNGRATGNGIEFYINPSVPNTEEGVKAWFAENPTDLVYELAEPLTVQLTANEISTVLGQNNIWNDCGDTEVEYRADTKLYINKVLNA